MRSPTKRETRNVFHKYQHPVTEWKRTVRCMYIVSVCIILVSFNQLGLFYLSKTVSKLTHLQELTEQHTLEG